MNKKYVLVFVSLPLVFSFLWYAMQKSVPKSGITKDYSLNVPEKVRDEAMVRLMNIKVASVYESVNDGANNFNRSVKDVSNIFNETNTDLILRGWLRWKPQILLL